MLEIVRSALGSAVERYPLRRALRDTCLMPLDPLLGILPGLEAADRGGKHPGDLDLDSEERIFLQNFVGRAEVRVLLLFRLAHPSTIHSRLQTNPREGRFAPQT